MEITRRAEYAVTALVDLALRGDGQFTSSREIAERQGIPVNFIPQIIASLSRQGWVEGLRGPGGGVRLIVNPKEITVKDVIEVMEGPMAITRCLLNEEPCQDRETCPLREIWARAQQKMEEVLEDISIADLAAAKRALSRKRKGRRD